MAQGKTYTEISKKQDENGYKTLNGELWQLMQVQRLIALYNNLLCANLYFVFTQNTAQCANFVQIVSFFYFIF